MTWYQTIAVIAFVFVLVTDFAIAARKHETLVDLLVRAFMVVIFPFLLEWL